MVVCGTVRFRWEAPGHRVCGGGARARAHQPTAMWHKSVESHCSFLLPDASSFVSFLLSFLYIFSFCLAFFSFLFYKWLFYILLFSLLSCLFSLSLSSLPQVGGHGMVWTQGSGLGSASGQGKVGEPWQGRQGRYGQATPTNPVAKVQP